MKLSQIKTVEKPGSSSGAEALQTFFNELEDNLPILEDLVEFLITGSGAPLLCTYEYPSVAVNVKHDAAGYVVRVYLKTQDVDDLTVDERMLNGSFVDSDSPIEIYITFALPAKLAIDVALADVNDVRSTIEHIKREAGGFIYRVTKTFGQTEHYKYQRTNEQKLNAPQYTNRMYTRLLLKDDWK